MTLHTLASGSEGNCLLVSCNDTHILVDAGISLRRIKTGLAQLDLTMEDLDGILLTHEHSDHVAGLKTMMKHHDVPLYASAGTARQLSFKVDGILSSLQTVETDAVFPLGECQITVFPTSHDARESIDFRIDSEEGSVGILTDTGYVTDEAREALCGVDLLVLESNHEPEWLRTGPYPYPLKQRILGPWGHLSNQDAAQFAVEMARQGTQQIILAHLSKENNTPAQALEVVSRAIRAEELDTEISVAPRKDLSPAYCLEGILCRK